MVMGQSIVLSEIKTEGPLENDDPAYQNFLLQQYEERLERDSVACREYTLPRNENLSEPEGWIRGNTNIGPVLEVTTSYLQGKYGVEIRIESMNKEHPHSWVRIFSWIEQVGHGLEQQGARRQRAGNLRDAVRRLCVEIVCICFCEPIKG